jgi:elongation factor G
MTPAREYSTDRIRNVAVLGHGGSGKSTLIDALCYVSGSSEERGGSGNGRALTMFTPEELDHGISIQLGVAHAPWQDTKVNLLDTPGYLDFTGDTVAATRVADGAVIVVSPTAGVEVGTEKVWEYCEERGLPRVFFVSGMDREHADFEKVYLDIKNTLSEKVIPVEIPVGSGEDFRGIINLFSGRTHMYRPGSDRGEYDEADVPPELQDKFEAWRTELFEAIATTDDTLLEQYLEEDGIGREQAIEAMKKAMGRGEMIPLFSGAAEKAWGTRALLSKLVELMPSPAEAAPEHGSRPELGEALDLAASDDGPLAALVFKTTAEPFVGELSFLRVCSGTLESGQEVFNPVAQATEKLDHLAIPQGKERLAVPRLHAGDIGVVPRLKHTGTNHTLTARDRPIVVDPIPFPEPDVSTAIRAATRKDEERIGQALSRLHEEDPTFHAAFEPELRQTIVRGMGELHLEIQAERLKRKYGVSVTTEEPRIAYRETIRKEVEAHGRHKKQTGGHGQFGDCHIRLRPLSRGEGYRFVDSIVGGVIPGKFIPSVDKGIQEAARRGIVAGFPVVDFEAEVFHGSHHSVDSSDVAFQVAGSIAFRKAAQAANPVLLEPIMQVDVVTPEDFVGDVIGDLNHRRAKILGMEPDGRKTRVRALVPQAELYRYGTALRSMTQGRAVHRRSMHGYEEVPPHVAAKVIEAVTEQREAAS